MELALQGCSCKAVAGTGNPGAGAGDAGVGLQGWACRTGAWVWCGCCRAVAVGLESCPELHD